MLEFDSVSFSYKDINIFNNISCKIERNAFTCIIGMNGSGKTTFGKLAVGLLSPQLGEISYNATPLSKVRIGYLQQSINFPNGMPLSVKEFVMMGLTKPNKLFFSKNDIRKTEQAIEKSNIQDKINTPVQNLSGGQLQRALIARLLISEPEFAVFDEPFESLDFNASQVLLEELYVLKQSMTVLMISHNSEMISALADKVLCISNHQEHHNFIEYFLSHKQISVEHICV